MVVFDGGVPVLKIKTIQKRQQLKSRGRATVEKTAEKLFAAQLKLHALQSTNNDSTESSSIPLKRQTVGAETNDDLFDEVSPIQFKQSDIDLQSVAKRQKQDPFMLPPLQDLVPTSQDPRLVSTSESKLFIQRTSQHFDLTSPEFKSLPLDRQYEIAMDLVALSRAPNSDRVQALQALPTPLDFSKAQIKNLVHRATLSSSLSQLGRGVTSGIVASARQRGYVLVNQEKGRGMRLGATEEGHVALTSVVGMPGFVKQMGRDVAKYMMIGNGVGNDLVTLSDCDENVAVDVARRLGNLQNTSRSTPSDPETAVKSIHFGTAGDAVPDSESAEAVMMRFSALDAQQSISKTATDSISYNHCYDIVPIYQHNDTHSLNYDPNSIQYTLPKSSSHISIDQTLRSLDYSRTSKTALPDSCTVEEIMAQFSDMEEQCSVATFLHSKPQQKQGSIIFTTPIEFIAEWNERRPKACDRLKDMETITYVFLTKTCDELMGLRNCNERKRGKCREGSDDDLCYHYFGTFLDSVIENHNHIQKYIDLATVETENEKIDLGTDLFHEDSATVKPKSVIYDFLGFSSDDEVEDGIPTLPLTGTFLDPIEIDDNEEWELCIPSEKISPKSISDTVITHEDTIDVDVISDKDQHILNDNDLSEIVELEGSQLSDQSLVINRIRDSQLQPESTPNNTIYLEVFDDEFESSLKSHVAVSLNLNLTEEPMRSQILDSAKESVSATDNQQAITEVILLSSDDDEINEVMLNEESCFDSFIETIQPASSLSNSTNDTFFSSLAQKSKSEVTEELHVEISQLAQQHKKQRGASDEPTEQMTAEIQSLLSVFGIPFITSPLESEATCAYLERTKQVNAVVTDDSDVFLFGLYILIRGANKVYKNLFNQNKYVEVFEASKFNDLSRVDLVCFAMLTGSDYTTGIHSVGPVYAEEIIKLFPGFQGLDDFKKWKLNLETPEEFDFGCSNKLKKLAKRIDVDARFPEREVYDAYMSPIVDESNSKFSWGIPDLDGIRIFMNSKARWAQSTTDKALVPAIKAMQQPRERQSAIDDFFTVTTTFRPAIKKVKVNPMSKTKARGRGRGRSK